jgi:hypothetical protein
MPSLIVVLRGLKVAERRCFGFYAEVFLSLVFLTCKRRSFVPTSLEHTVQFET